MLIWDCPYKPNSELLHYIPTPAAPRGPDEMQTLGISIPPACAFCRIIFLWDHNIWELWSHIAPSAGTAARELHGLGLEFTRNSLQGTYTLLLYRKTSIPWDFHSNLSKKSSAILEEREKNKYLGDLKKTEKSITNFHNWSSIFLLLGNGKRGPGASCTWEGELHSHSWVLPEVSNITWWKV